MEQGSNLMDWHEIEGSPRYDFSQAGELGVVWTFGTDVGAGRADAVPAGYGIAAEVVVAPPETSESYTVTVVGLEVANRGGMDIVTVKAATANYSWSAQTPPTEESEHVAGDVEWSLRFGMEMVPGNQLKGPAGETIDDADLPPAEKLMPQPTIIAEQRKWLARVSGLLPAATKAAAMALAATYSAASLPEGGALVEQNAPKVSYTLNSYTKFLCTGIEIEDADRKSVV